MKLQVKMTLTLLIVSLITAATVGVVAYWSLMSDFRQSVKDEAFNNFQADITDYLHTYGSLDAGERVEPFIEFVRRRRIPAVPISGEAPLRPGLPPFRFMVLDPDGRVLRDGGDIHAGQKVSAQILERARPILVNGKIAVQVVQIGHPVLTEQDRNYLKVMRKALISGIACSALMAVIFGLLLGNRLGLALRLLSDAIRKMRLDGALKQKVPVRSKDEIGELARAFNTMNDKLTRAYAELQESHDKIQLQAQKLLELSIRDPLTAMFNRRHFDAQAARFSTNLSAIIVSSP